MRFLVAIIAIALVAPSAVADEQPPVSSVAQDNDEPPPPPWQTTAPADTKPPPTPERSVSAAFLVPFSVTALGLGLVLRNDDLHSTSLRIGVGAMIVGPPLGRIYARDISWFGVGLEAAGVGLAYHAVTSGSEAALVTLLYGTVIYGAGALYQIVSAPIVVHRSNQRHRAMLVPTTNDTGGGLALVGAF